MFSLRSPSNLIIYFLLYNSFSRDWILDFILSRSIPSMPSFFIELIFLSLKLYRIFYISSSYSFSCFFNLFINSSFSFFSFSSLYCPSVIELVKLTFFFSDYLYFYRNSSQTFSPCTSFSSNFALYFFKLSTSSSNSLIILFLYFSSSCVLSFC